MTAEKLEILRIAALTDRGQQLFKESAYAPLNEYAGGREEDLRRAVNRLRASGKGRGDVDTISLLNGEWELIFASKQLFRSSPFFMAIQESMRDSTWHAPWSSPDTAVPSGDLFFRLHELQVMSWGASTVGKVTQTINVDEGTFFSSFDTILFRLTTVPVLGWGKLLPTFGGRVSSFADRLAISMEEGENKRGGNGSENSDHFLQLTMSMELQRTQVDACEGIPKPPFFLSWLLGTSFPVNAVWNLLPWNRKPPLCTTTVIYVDEDMRVNEDSSGELSVYVRMKPRIEEKMEEDDGGETS